MDATDIEPFYVTVDVWHPNCWTLQTTETSEGGLFGHGMTVNENKAAERFTVYDVSKDAVEALITTISDSDLTEKATVIASPAPSAASALGPVTRDVLVTFDPTPSLRDAFDVHGFLHYGPTWHENGHEHRTLLARTTRSALQQALHEIETTYDAVLEVTRLATAAPPKEVSKQADDQLSPRQREAFQLARTRGYYEYPHGVTVRELAADLNISKTTFCEHLRKAESKLLNSIILDPSP